LGTDTKPVHLSQIFFKLVSMMNRENALAATWASAYSIALVLVVALADSLAVTPFYYVPFVILVLPFLVAMALSPFQNPRQGDQP
jgi:hypothetical protein